MRSTLFFLLLPLLLVVGLLGGTPAAGAPPVLYLHTEFFPYDNPHPNAIAQRLDRELVRQALLIAAREELGIECYDETLDERAPEGDHVVHLIVSERGSFKGTWNIKLYRYPADGNWRAAEPIWEKDYQTSKAGSRHYASFTPMLEQESREAFVEALKLAGLEKQPATEQADEPEPAKPARGKASLDELLLRVDFVAQFGAIHRLHNLLATHGETPERLQQLARAYAQLSLLTGHTWNASTEVFAARAMLYAQRSVVSTDSSPDALWTRAYTYALTGSLQHAEKDLQTLGVELAATTPEVGEAEESDTEEPADETEGKTDNGKTTAPDAWRKLVVPYVLCDREGLRKLARENEGLAPWALELDFQLALAFRYPKWMYDAAGRLFQTTPTAYHAAVELANRTVDLLVSRTGAYYGPAYFGSNLAESVGAIPQLPKAVEGQLPLDAVRRTMLAVTIKDPNPDDNFSPLPSHIAKILRTTSPSEPSRGLSWDVLAYLIEEEQFVMAAALCKVSQNATESDHTEMVDGLLPLVKGHRYAGYIECYRYNPRTQFEERKRALKDVKLRDARGNMLAILRALKEVNPANDSQAVTAWNQSARNFTMQGSLEKCYLTDHRTYNNYRPADLRMLGGELSRIAPHLEVSTRLIIEGAEKPTVEQLAKWEESIKLDPDSLAMLASHYFKLGRFDEAIRCYERSLDTFPTFENARQLANMYWNRHDYEKWQGVYKKFIAEAPDTSLQHAQAHAQLANGHAFFGQYSKAKPHALRAGATYSAWGLLCASEMCEALAHWDESEQWVQAASQSYPTGSGHYWYFWCRRTGRGDVDSAHQLAERFFTSLRPPQPTRDQHLLRGTYAILEEDFQEARRHFERANSMTPEGSASCTFMIALLNRHLDEEEASVEMLEKFKEVTIKRLTTEPASKDAWEACLEIIELMLEQEASTSQLERLEKALAGVKDDPTRSTYCYIVGCELAAIDEVEHAERYWRIALSLPYRNYMYATLAGSELATRYGTSRVDDEPITGDDIWPKREIPAAFK